jgi:hypothetical protein
MSLNWDATKCDPSTVEVRRKWMAVIPWLCLQTGMPSITAKNVEEFYLRSQMLREMRGSVVPESETLPLEDLRAFVGLTTNVSPRTLKQFGKHLASILRTRVEDALRRDREKTAVADGE